MGAAWLSGAVLWNIREYRMFIGSINAGNRAADLLSLVSSATRNNLDVLVYVKDVLDRLLCERRDYEAMPPPPPTPGISRIPSRCGSTA